MPRRRVAKTWGEGSRRAVAAESGDVPYHERWAFPVLTFPAEAAVRMAAEEPACAGWVRPGGKSREAVSETGESVPASESAEREAFLPLVRSGQIGVGRERTSGALFRRRAGRGLRPAGNVHRQLFRKGRKGPCSEESRGAISCIRFSQGCCGRAEPQRLRRKRSACIRRTEIF